MKEVHLFYAPELPDRLQLPADEANHAVRVLRMKEGDTLLATDGRGTFYDCIVSLASAKHCDVSITGRHEAPRPWNGRIHLAMAPTKNIDRTEWFAEKATEIGFDRLTFLDCKNSERRVVKPERIERIVTSAMKQSHKAQRPVVDEMTPFKEFIKQPFEGQKFIAHCYDMAEDGGGPLAEESMRTTFLGDVVDSDGESLVLIGPEGDFSTDEVKAAIAAGFRPISLGRSRLRTETAALVAVHIMNLAKRLR